MNAIQELSRTRPMIGTETKRKNRKRKECGDGSDTYFKLEIRSEERNKSNKKGRQLQDENKIGHATRKITTDWGETSCDISFPENPLVTETQQTRKGPLHLEETLHRKRYSQDTNMDDSLSPPSPQLLSDISNSTSKSTLLSQLPKEITTSSPHRPLHQPEIGQGIDRSNFGQLRSQLPSQPSSTSPQTPQESPSRGRFQQTAQIILVVISLHQTLSPHIRLLIHNDVWGTVRFVTILGIGIIALGFLPERRRHEQQKVRHQQKEDRLLSAKDKLETIHLALQAMETSIAITDCNGTIVWCNSSFVSMANHDYEESWGLTGRSIQDVVQTIDPSKQENRDIISKALTDKSTFDRWDEIQILSSVYRVETTPFSQTNDDSSTGSTSKQFLVLFHDVTADRARQRSENVAQEEAMMAKAMGDSMVTLTHELRTPLQGIMGITSLLLQAQDLTRDKMESLKLIMASSNWLLNLINNLLDVKKATAKTMEDFPLSSVPAADPIKDSVVFCRPLASISEVEIVTDISASPHALVRSNAVRLQQILINLLSNAIKHTERKSQISVRIQQSTIFEVHQKIKGSLAHSECNSHDCNDPQQPILIFSVSDSGCGIAEDQAHKLFQRFAQLNNSKPGRILGTRTVGQSSGTGLGLHLCELFVKRMNGHIWATNNKDDCGCTFSFSLPLLSENETKLQRQPSSLNMASMASHETPQSPPPLERPMNQPTILYVDDTLINRKVVSKVLQQIGYTRVTTVNSGHAAMTELLTKGNHYYDIIITDLNMPGMSGTELSRSIFNEDASSFRKPVVVGLTANSSKDVVARCKASGMSDVLFKPITAERMKEYMETKVPFLQAGVWYNE